MMTRMGRLSLLCTVVLAMPWTSCGLPPNKNGSGPGAKSKPDRPDYRLVAMQATVGDTLTAGPKTFFLHPETLEPVAELIMTSLEIEKGRLIPAIHETPTGDVLQYLLWVQPRPIAKRPIIQNGDQPVDFVIQDNFDQVQDIAKVTVRAGDEVIATADRIVAYTRYDSLTEVGEIGPWIQRPVQVFDGETPISDRVFFDNFVRVIGVTANENPEGMTTTTSGQEVTLVPQILGEFGETHHIIWNATVTQGSATILNPTQITDPSVNPTPSIHVIPGPSVGGQPIIVDVYATVGPPKVSEPREDPASVPPNDPVTSPTQVVGTDDPLVTIPTQSSSVTTYSPFTGCTNTISGTPGGAGATFNVTPGLEPVSSSGDSTGVIVAGGIGAVAAGAVLIDLLSGDPKKEPETVVVCGRVAQTAKRLDDEVKKNSKEPKTGLLKARAKGTSKDNTPSVPGKKSDRVPDAHVPKGGDIFKGCTWIEEVTPPDGEEEHPDSLPGIRDGNKERREGKKWGFGFWRRWHQVSRWEHSDSWSSEGLAKLVSKRVCKKPDHRFRIEVSCEITVELREAAKSAGAGSSRAEIVVRTPAGHVVFRTGPILQKRGGSKGEKEMKYVELQEKEKMDEAKEAKEGKKVVHSGGTTSGELKEVGNVTRRKFADGLRLEGKGEPIVAPVFLTKLSVAEEKDQPRRAIGEGLLTKVVLGVSCTGCGHSYAWRMSRKRDKGAIKTEQGRDNELEKKLSVAATGS